MRNIDKIGSSNGITGHLEIWKIYDDREEKVFDDHNLIVSGMGVGLAYLFSNTGSTSILDYQIRYFQAGSGAPANFDTSTYKLGGPLQEADYGTSTEVVISTHSQLQNETVATNQDFVQIPQNHMFRIGNVSVRYHLYLGKHTANDLPNALNEVGLFMANPKGQATEESILVAYRTHSNITKTIDFSLLYKWTITF